MMTLKLSATQSVACAGWYNSEDQDALALLLPIFQHARALAHETGSSVTIETREGVVVDVIIPAKWCG